MYESMYKFWEMVITLDCEHVILVIQSGGQGHTGDSGHVSPGTVFEGSVMLDSVEMRSQVQGREGVTLNTVAM